MPNAFVGVEAFFVFLRYLSVFKESDFNSSPTHDFFDITYIRKFLYIIDLLITLLYENTR